MTSCPSRNTVALNGTTSPAYAFAGHNPSGCWGARWRIGIRPMRGALSVVTGSTYRENDPRNRTMLSVLPIVYYCVNAYIGFGCDDTIA